MIFTNHLVTLSTLDREVLNTFLVLLNPFAPHLSEEINEKLGTTFLLVTHDKDVASQCSRILTMDDGLMVDTGRGEEEE